MFIPKERLLRVLDSFNPWWTTGMIHPSYTKTFHKTAFDEISYIVRPEERGGGKERGILLAGGRGLGKTTMIYQLAEMGVKNGINPKAILYVPMEHTVLKLAGVDEALSCYHENV
jgi:predicted AAA+ superfamily ATPase